VQLAGLRRAVSPRSIVVVWFLQIGKAQRPPENLPRFGSLGRLLKLVEEGYIPVDHVPTRFYIYKKDSVDIGNQTVLFQHSQVYSHILFLQAANAPLSIYGMIAPLAQPTK
jgi:hypothetical protein